MVTTAKIKLRTEPADFTNRDLRELGEVIKKNNLFCKGYDWNQEFSNDEGKFQGNYENNLDGTVTDKSTGLMWQKAHRPAYGRWQKAKEYVAQLNAEFFAGYNDWRLPTIEECCSLFTRERENDGLFISPLFTNRMWLWTCDVKDAGQNLIWNANMLYGSIYWIDAANGQDIRAVRTAVNKPGRQFYQDHLRYLVQGNIEIMLENQYHRDAVIITFAGNWTGLDTIKKYYTEKFSPDKKRITSIQLHKFNESADLIAYQRTLTTNETEVMKNEEALYLINGKILRQMVIS